MDLYIWYKVSNKNYWSLPICFIDIIFFLISLEVYGEGITIRKEKKVLVSCCDEIILFMPYVGGSHFSLEWISFRGGGEAKIYILCLCFK